MPACPPRLAHRPRNERLVHKPESAWGRRLAERIDGWQALRAAWGRTSAAWPGEPAPDV